MPMVSEDKRLIIKHDDSEGLNILNYDQKDDIFMLQG